MAFDTGLRMDLAYQEMASLLVPLRLRLYLTRQLYRHSTPPGYVELFCR